MESHLHWADYVILVIFLIISLAIGVYHSLTGGRQKTTAEFILGNRKLKVIPTAISLLVSFMSGILFIGAAAEVYSYGVQFTVFIVVSSTIALVIVERFIVPWLYPMKLVSIFDYLEKRYMSKSIRIFGALMGIISGVLFMGVAMYAPSAALESATGVPLTVSIPLMAVVSVIYTALGGMRAVIWTDVFQFIIMMVGLIAILIKGLISVGGISNVFRLAGDEGRLVWANLSADPRERNTVWGLVIGMTFAWIGAYGVSQTAVQRYSSVDTLAKARAAILVNIPPLILAHGACGFVGMIVLAYYSSIKCDPLENKDVGNTNQLLPHFVVTIFADSPGFAGLFLSVLYGGSLGSVSSALSGSAANCWEDILKYKLDHLPEGRKAIINRLLVVLFGALSIGVAFLAASVDGPIMQVSIGLISSVTGPMIALFLLGAASKHANWKGAMIGGMVAILLNLWLNIGSLTMRNIHNNPLPPVSVEQCHLRNGNSTLFNSTMNYTDYTFFEIFDGIDAKDNWNGTTENRTEAEHPAMIPLQGLENFYALSYLWITLFGSTVTGVVGIIASLIMRDRELEAKVDERLLLRVRCWGWSEENENEEKMDDKNYTACEEVVPVLSLEKNGRAADHLLSVTA